MTNFDERKATIMEMMKDPDLTMKERYRYIYHWYRYETALKKKAKARGNIDKYAAKMNADNEVVALRKKMKNL